MIEVRAGARPVGQAGARPVLRLRPDLHARRPPSGPGLADPGRRPAETIAGAGHFLQEEKGEEIADRIVRFLSEG